MWRDVRRGDKDAVDAFGRGVVVATVIERLSGRAGRISPQTIFGLRQCSDLERSKASSEQFAAANVI
jgi:hypothetical protein